MLRHSAFIFRDEIPVVFVALFLSQLVMENNMEFFN